MAAIRTKTRSISVQEVTAKEEWNTFLRGQHSVHVMQTYEWGELNQYRGARIYRLGASIDGELAGILQLLLLEVPPPIPLPGLKLKYLYGIRGPVVASPDSPALAALLNAAQKLAEQEKAIVLRLEPNIADDDSDVEAWKAIYARHGFVTNPETGLARRSWVLDISPTEEVLLANYKITWRQNVRVSVRKGVTIREADGEQDFAAYYSILSDTARRDNFFIHSQDYHHQMYQRFRQQGDAVLYLAEHEGEVLAAKMLIRVGDWCWDMFGGSLEKKRNLKATYPLQHQCLLWAKAQGCHYFDFRSIPFILEPGQEMWGIYEFKKGFGGFSRLTIASQDYVYRPMIYRIWNGIIKWRHQQRQRAHAKRMRSQAEGEKAEL